VEYLVGAARLSHPVAHCDPGVIGAGGGEKMKKKKKKKERLRKRKVCGEVGKYYGEGSTLSRCSTAPTIGNMAPELRRKERRKREGKKNTRIKKKSACDGGEYCQVQGRGGAKPHAPRLHRYAGISDLSTLRKKRKKKEEGGGRSR